MSRWSSGSSTRYLYLYFFRGVQTDPSEGGAGSRHVPWFRRLFRVVEDASLEPPMAVGDFDGDGYPDLAVGDPTRTSFDLATNKSVHGMVTVYFVNSPDRFASDPANIRATWGAEGIERYVNITSSAVGLPQGIDHGFGSSLTAGGFTTHLRDDLVIGAPKASELQPPVYQSSGSGVISTIGSGARQGGAIVHIKDVGEGPNGWHSAVTWNPEAFSHPLARKTREFGASLTKLALHCQAPTFYDDAIVVGDPGYDSARGAIFVYGCAGDASELPTTAPLRLSVKPPLAPGDRYGETIQGFTTGADYDPDHAYVVVGAPFDDHAGFTDLGSVHLEEITRAGVHTHLQTVRPLGSVRRNNMRFGSALAVHRLPADSFSTDHRNVRIAVGAPRAWHPDATTTITGRVVVWYPWTSGSGGAFHVLGPGSTRAGARFGTALAAIGDRRSGGGFAVGAPKMDILTVTLNGFIPVVEYKESGGVEVHLDSGNNQGQWQGSRQTLHEETRGDKRVQ